MSCTFIFCLLFYIIKMVIKMEKIIICPNEEKLNLLEEFRNTKELSSIKFMTKKEFIDNALFTYDETALEYLMNTYHYNLDVCKVYLKNLYPIDITKDYKSDKLNFLKDLKIVLLEKGFLKENKPFKEYLKGKTIELRSYYELDKYEEELIGTKLDINIVEKPLQVVECSTLEEEINNVCINIRNLLNSGVDINKIFLSNVSNDDIYTIEKLFSYYQIPINLNKSASIFGTKVVNDYLKTKEIDLENTSNLKINRKLVNTINSISRCNPDLPSYEIILKDKLKQTSIPSNKLANAVNIKKLGDSVIKDDEYIFVIGFNQDILPKMEKDIEFISDKEKEELSLYKTYEINARRKKVLMMNLCNINHLYLSYKKSSPFSNYYPSSLIEEYNIEVIKPITDTSNYSNIYNKIRYAEYLDNFYKYGEENKELRTYNTHYNIDYNTYSNKFTGIDNNIYLSNIKQPLNLSYSVMNQYSECAFKYYVNNVLHLSTYEDKFPSFIGSLYHEILSLYERTNFDFEKEYNKYLETRELTLKERLLLVKIKRDLVELIESLKKQKLITGYDSSYFEKKIEIPLDKKISVIFKGFVDKIMYYENMGETYYTVIDYKSGYIDTNIEPMKYGLHMQLPVYLYLIKYSNIFTKPKFTGIYYQNILFNYPTCSNDEEYIKTIKDRLKLQGYSIDDTSILERFDTTYEKSEYIKSMNYSEEKGFGRFAKVISEETKEELVEYTKDYINKTTDKILDGKFPINPKYYNGKNVSCEFCEFKDICFSKEKDMVYLEKVEDLSFLGGDL